ncbi:MAG: F0F1 ATP synthase subunit A [Rhodospirillaceae bacterium]|nr:F0F1 ATP synthase subunit A [Rhodospirillaceae bacterium]MBT4219474.1 F0F1 ATP synthase subunit A [Rhodospirillaceae bacterium]MBT4464485.1 F0F1 ATP synthase subunit A [Rhodospirillaceae bacterium]MBT6406295.1 F0F1 ATP synthase subunit A [Rhodospirillaceae bacterium]MBT7356741.1 F0F1 ATP synthase subunit A [Rhodospirillaceae bacterium]
MANPLEQFTIKTLVPIQLGEVNASLTNAGLFMVLTVAAVTLFLTLGMTRRAAVPGRWQSMAELSYEFIAGMIRDNVGNEGRRYFPFVFSLFMFILFANLIGMIPYSFTFTSHIAVTFTMAMVVFLGVTVIAIIRHGLHFFSFFLPTGVPMVMAPILVPIEVLSYLSRPISLSIRLFANMMAGHTMIKVFAGFVIPLGILGGWAPLTVIVALTAFEFLVAFLQAYVFTVLTCLYLNDAIHLH